MCARSGGPSRSRRAAIGRGLLLALGGTVLAILAWRAGPRVILGMLRRVGWTVVPIAALYTAHLIPRAVALWRSLPDGAAPLLYIVRMRLAVETVEILTFTGPFLAEPAKGWLLTRRGIGIAHAFGAVAIEYLIYTVVSAWMATAALGVLLGRGLVPHEIRGAVMGVVVGMLVFTAGFVFAAVSGVGLLVPSVRALAGVIGRPRAQTLAARIGPTERVLVDFMHARPARLAEVVLLEALSHAMLAAEIWIIFSVLGLHFTPADPFLVEGGIKFISVVFFFIPGQIGASEGVYSLIVGALGFPAAVGLTVVTVRRIRSLLVAGLGTVVGAGLVDTT